jgi:hypothetical protein
MPTAAGWNGWLDGDDEGAGARATPTASPMLGDFSVCASKT